MDCFNKAWESQLENTHKCVGWWYQVQQRTHSTPVISTAAIIAIIFAQKQACQARTLQSSILVHLSYLLYTLYLNTASSRDKMYPYTALSQDVVLYIISSLKISLDPRTPNSTQYFKYCIVKCSACSSVDSECCAQEKWETRFFALCCTRVQHTCTRHGTEHIMGIFQQSHHINFKSQTEWSNF